KSGADATTGEGRSIRFLLYQRIAFKFFDRGSITLQGKKGIMLFRSGTGEWLKPMGIMRYAHRLGPGPDTGSNLVGHIALNLLSRSNRRKQALVSLIAEVLPGFFQIKNIFTKNRSHFA